MLFNETGGAVVGDFVIQNLFMRQSDCSTGEDINRDNMDPRSGTLMWTAPEIFRGDRCNDGKADVFSFGVVMWEIATREKPWDIETRDLQMQNSTEFVKQSVQSGRRPVVPTHVTAEHAEYTSVLEQCWADDPSNRPTFGDISAKLATLLRTALSADEVILENQLDEAFLYPSDWFHKPLGHRKAGVVVDNRQPISVQVCRDLTKVLVEFHLRFNGAGIF